MSTYNQDIVNRRESTETPVVAANIDEASLSNSTSTGATNTDQKSLSETHQSVQYRCPTPRHTCEWQGPLDQVLQHLLTHEHVSTIQGEDIVFLAGDINVPGPVDWTMIQSCFGHDFLLSLDKNEHENFCVTVRLIGSPQQAENFVYRMELNGARQSFIIETLLFAIPEGVNTPIDNIDFVQFSNEVAQSFADDGFLCINFSISWRS